MDYERLVRNLRRHPLLFDTSLRRGGKIGDDSEDDHKIHRILHKALAAARKQRERTAPPEPVGPYSGLTRRELAATRTCEPDWF